MFVPGVGPRWSWIPSGVGGRAAGVPFSFPGRSRGDLMHITCLDCITKLLVVKSVILLLLADP